MQKSQIFTQQELTILRKKGVDTELCEVILNDYNRGKIGKNPPLTPLGVPDIDGEQILNLRAPSFFYFKEEEYRRFKSLYPQASSFLHPENNKVSLKEIEKAGIALLPCFAFGFLNGGSATSYGDVRKNRAFNQDLFELYEEDFLRLSAKVKGQPKGITPAFNRKGEEKAPSYMELKLRSLLLLVKKYRELCGEGLKEGIPFFQMTSLATDSPVKEALKTYRKSPWLKPLAESLNIPPWQGFTAQQPLLAAYSHSKEGEKKKIFRKEDASFPFILLPGGHGQCFRVLGKVWQQLYDRGIRYVSLGNIDNLGYTPDPVELALMAIKQAPAGFDQSWKTAVDTKGGVLVVTEGGRLNCADIGAGISSRDIKELEKSGKKILFNCASGLFDLSWLLKKRSCLALGHLLLLPFKCSCLSLGRLAWGKLLYTLLLASSVLREALQPGLHLPASLKASREHWRGQQTHLPLCQSRCPPPNTASLQP